MQPKHPPTPEQARAAEERWTAVSQSLDLAMDSLRYDAPTVAEHVGMTADSALFEYVLWVLHRKQHRTVLLLCAAAFVRLGRMEKPQDPLAELDFEPEGDDT